MKRLFSIFLLSVMALNVTLTAIAQWRRGDGVEYTECGSEETKEKEKTEKEKEKESISVLEALLAPLASEERGPHCKPFPADERIVLESCVSLPEIPPEA